MAVTSIWKDFNICTAEET